MRNFLYRYKLLLFLFFILIIITLILSILFIDKRNKDAIKASQENNKELQIIEDKVKNLKIDNISNYREYNRALNYINFYYRKSADKKTKYGYLIYISDNLTSLYSLTNNPELYGIINKDLSGYAKNAFPDLFQEKFFTYSCQDASCAEKPQPKEISTIVNDINNSDFPDEIKKNISHDLVNAGYKSEQNESYIFGKVNQYVLIAQSIKSLDTQTKTGANIKIYNEVIDFIKSKYPDVYELFKEGLES